MEGKIKFYNRSKGFGFIIGEDGQEYYFNEAGINAPDQGDTVSFRLQKSQRGDVAKNIKVVGSELAATHKSPPAWKVIAFALVFCAVGVLIGYFIKH